MLDFNHRNVDSKAITAQLNKLIDQALILERHDKPARKYLGASRLGASCSRALQYEYIAAGNNENYEFNGQTLRIFEVGHLFEKIAIKWLKSAGFDLVTEDKNGQQFSFEVADSRIAGHIDGIITAAPRELRLAFPMLWETKSMNSKSWRETIKKGLVLSKPIYAAQIALYQAYMEASIPGISKNPCLFTAINKDTAEIYAELIPFDAELAQRMSDKAVNIIKATEAKEVLPRAFSSPDVLECKMCIYRSKCWNIRREENLYE